MKRIVIIDVLRTIRLFVENNLDEGEGWFSWLFAVARMLKVEPMELRELALLDNDYQVVTTLSKVAA